MGWNKRTVFWHRRHSIARVVEPGQWVGLGYPVPVVTPFIGPPSPFPPQPRREPDPELERVPAPASSSSGSRNGGGSLGQELETAARSGREPAETRGRGRPRKVTR